MVSSQSNSSLARSLNVCYQFDFTSTEASGIKDFLFELITPRIISSIKDGIIVVERKENAIDEFRIKIDINCKNRDSELSTSLRNGNKSIFIVEDDSTGNMNYKFNSYNDLLDKLAYVAKKLKPERLSLESVIKAATTERERSAFPATIEANSPEISLKESKRTLKEICSPISFQDVELVKKIKSITGLSSGVFETISTKKRWVGYSDSEEFGTSLQNCYKEIIALRFYAGLANNPQNAQAAIYKNLSKKSKYNAISCFHVLRELHPEIDSSVEEGKYQWDQGNLVRLKVEGRVWKPFWEVGLGHILAVASLIQDHDPIGPNGKNIAFRKGKFKGEEYARTIKIAANRCFEDDGLDYKDGDVSKALNGWLPFKNLPKKTQEEFKTTLNEILDTQFEAYFENVKEIRERENRIDSLKEEMLKMLKKRQEYLKKVKMDNFNNFWVRITGNIFEEAFRLPDLPHENEVRFIRKAMASCPDLKLYCLQKLSESRNSNASELLMKEAAQAMTILNYSNFNFSWLDLRGIRIPKASLCYGLFQNTGFQSANLEDVNFYGAWTAGANFTSSMKAGATFDEQLIDRLLPSYLIRGHRPGWAICAFSPDGRTLATAGHDKFIYIWDINAGVPVKRLQGHTGYIECLSWNSDGTLLVSGSTEKKIYLWDVRSQQLVKSPLHSTVITSCVFTPDDRQVVFRDYNSEIFYWKLDQNIVVKANYKLENARYLHLGCALNLKGELIAPTASAVWNLTINKEIYRADSNKSQITCFSFNSAGNLLVIGCKDKTLVISDPISDPEKKSNKLLEGHTNAVTCCGFTKGDKFIISGSEDKTVRVWSVETRKEVGKTNEFAAKVVSISILKEQEQSLFAVGDASGSVTLWELDNSDEDNVKLKLRWASHQAAFQIEREPHKNKP